MQGSRRWRTVSELLAAALAGAGAGAASTREDAACAALRGRLLPLRHSTGRYTPELGDGVELRGNRLYVGHRFSYTSFRGRLTGVVFFSGRARYRQDGRLQTEIVKGAIASDGHFDEAEWQHSGRLSDIDDDGTLQADKIVRGVSAALAYMEVGPVVDRALRTHREPIPRPTLRGTVGFQYWYACQRCVPGGATVTGGQRLSSARFAQSGRSTFVTTNMPRVIVAELAPTGETRRYFRCIRPIV